MTTIADFRLMPSWPTGVSCYKSTAEFDEHSIPKGLLASHQLKPNTWGRIVVSAGELLYTIEQPEEHSFVLSPSRSGVVAPELPHRVAARGAVRFRVDFYRRTGSGGGD